MSHHCGTDLVSMDSEGERSQRYLTSSPKTLGHGVERDSMLTDITRSSRIASWTRTMERASVLIEDTRTTVLTWIRNTSIA